MDSVLDIYRMVSARRAVVGKAPRPQTRSQHPHLWMSKLLYEICGPAELDECIRQVQFLSSVYIEVQLAPQSIHERTTFRQKYPLDLFRVTALAGVLQDTIATHNGARLPIGDNHQ